MDEDRRVFFAVKVCGETVNIVIQLAIERDSKESIRNFHKLVTSNDTASYKSTKFHRVVSPEFIIQGGAIEGFQGELLVKNEVNPESTTLDQKGLVVIASEVEDEVPSSEFFITLEDLSEFNALQGRFLVVGKVVNGLDKLIDLTKVVDVDEGNKPLEDIVITRTGELVKKKKPLLQDAINSVIQESVKDAGREPKTAEFDHESHRVSGRHKHSSRSHRRHHSRSSRDSPNYRDSRERHTLYDSKDSKDLDGRNGHSSRSYDRYGSRYYDHKDEYMDRDPKRLKSSRSRTEYDEVRKGRGFTR